MRVIQNGDLCLTVLGSGKFKIRVTPDLFVYYRLFSVSKTMPFVLLRKEEYCHHLQKVEGRKPLLKGLQLYSQGEYPLWIHYPLKAPITFTLRFQYLSLRGARCRHGLWLARMSSPLTWLPHSHGPDCISMSSQRSGAWPSSLNNICFHSLWHFCPGYVHGCHQREKLSY